MFDLFTGATKHSPRHQVLPVLVSVVAHVAVAGAIVIGGVLLAGDQLPEVRTMMAFAAPPPLPPPPPPPPAPQKTPPAEVKPVPVSADAAPVESPPEIVPEAPVTDVAAVDVYDSGGVVPGGGIVGGVSMAKILPPPPPPPAPREPIRVGGQIQQPVLVYRVSPVYPDVAVSARVEGIVILEAIVDEEGRVEDLKVLRSSGVLDRSALAAVRQWRYTPVVLNGRPEKFILTVVVTFSLSDAR